MANKKFTELLPADALPTLTGTDILAVTVDPNGATPVSNKTTIANLMGQAPVQSVAGRTGAVTLSNTDVSGLGTASTQDVGTANGNVVQLDATGLPAVDGSQLTNVSGTDSSKLAIANNLSDLNNVATARFNLGVDAAGTDNSTDVSLDTTSHDYLSLTGQTIALGAIDLSTDVTGSLPNTSVSGLGTAATTASTDYATSAQGELADSAQQPPTEGAFVDGDKLKLDNIEALADVTDTANVTAAGALMDSEVTNLAQVKAFDSADYATAAQGSLADTATQPADNVSTLTNDSGYITGVTAGELGDFDFDDNAILGFSASKNDQTGTTYTVAASDNGKVVVLNNASAITVDIDTGLPAGFNCSFIQKGAGQVSFAGTATVNNRQSHTKINGQYGVASIVAYDTDTYILAGDTAS